MGANLMASFVVFFFQCLIIVGVYGMALWKYYESTGPPDWISYNLAPMYGTFAAIAGTILFFLIAIGICCCVSKKTTWRPSVIVYIFLCALPCHVLLLVSHLQKRKNVDHDELAHILGAFQAIVAGLLLMEWIAKFRIEKMTYNALEDAIIDFFFAYDVFEFYDRYFEKEATRDQQAWLIPTVIFAFIAMFKYIPVRPINMEDPCAFNQARRYILFGMIFNDIPFVLMRLTSIGLYGVRVVDVIHPVKNIVLIIIGALQILQLNRNKKDSSKDCIRRCERGDILHPV